MTPSPAVFANLTEEGVGGADFVFFLHLTFELATFPWHRRKLTSPGGEDVDILVVTALVAMNCLDVAGA